MAKNSDYDLPTNCYIRSKNISHNGKPLSESIDINITTDGEPVKCGFKIDNHDVYVKRISLKNLPNKGEVWFDIGIDFKKIEIIGFLGAITRWNNSERIPLPFIWGDTNSVANYVAVIASSNGNTVGIRTNRTDISNYTGALNIYFYYL